MGAVSVAFGSGAQGAFGPDGKEILRLQGTPERALKHGKSGMLLLGRFFGEERGIVRLRANGSIDRSFGAGGFVGIPWTDVAVQRDGHILVLSSHSASPSSVDTTLTRLRPDGQPDPAFGNGGALVVELGNSFDFGTALALTPDGKIVVAGDTSTRLPEGRGGAPDGPPVIARLLPGGAPDRSFSGDGRKALPQVGSTINLRVARSGTIVAFTGHSLIKVRSTGQLETSFGDGGVVWIATLDPAPGEEFFSPVDEVGLLPEGKLVVAGTVSRAVNDELRYRVMAMRFKRDGSLDRSYGDNGYAKAGFRGWMFASSLAVLARGRVVVAGNAQVPVQADSDAAAIVFGSNGSPARGIGQGGKIRVPFPGWVFTEDIVRLAGGRVALIGSSSVGETRPITVLARVPLR